MEQGFFDWATLLTPAAASAAVLLIVQYTKAGIDKVFGKIPTRVFVLVLSLLVVLGAHAFAGDGLDWKDVLLVPVNAVVVAAAAMGEYEVIFADGDKQKKTEPPENPDNPA